MTALAAKGEISDCFHISTVICVVYFSTFNHEIHKKNMNQKMHGGMFKKICVHDCVLSVLGHPPADDGVRLWYQTRHTSGSRAALARRLPSDLRQQPGRGSPLPPSALCHHQRSVLAQTHTRAEQPLRMRCLLQQVHFQAHLHIPW